MAGVRLWSKSIADVTPVAGRGLVDRSTKRHCRSTTAPSRRGSVGLPALRQGVAAGNCAAGISVQFDKDPWSSRRWPTTIRCGWRLGLPRGGAVEPHTRPHPCLLRAFVQVPSRPVLAGLVGRRPGASLRSCQGGLARASLAADGTVEPPSKVSGVGVRRPRKVVRITTIIRLLEVDHLPGDAPRRAGVTAVWGV